MVPRNKGKAVKAQGSVRIALGRTKAHSNDVNASENQDSDQTTARLPWQKNK